VLLAPADALQDETALVARVATALGEAEALWRHTHVVVLLPAHELIVHLTD
jgi:hypothetical protein